MDTPKVGPLTPIGSLLKSVSRVLLDPNGRPVDPTKTGGTNAVDSTKRPVAQAPTQEVETKDNKFKTLESMLPIKILANPMLKGSEWAWKRLITSLLENVNISLSEQNQQDNILNPEMNSGVHSDAAKDAIPVVLNELQSSKSSTVQEALSWQQDFNIVRPSIATITDGGDLQPAHSNPVKPNQNTNVQENRGNSVVVENHESNLASPVSASIHSVQPQTTELTLSGGISETITSISGGLGEKVQGTVASEPQLESTLLVSSPTGLKSHPSAIQSSVSGLPVTGSTGNQYEAAIKVLWSMLTVASNQSNRDKAKAEVSGFHDKGPIVEFAGLSHSEFKGELPQTVQQWVVEDRLTASVQFDTYERIGQGIFFPPGQHTETTRHAVRWRAKKQTKITGQGKLIHRIQFDLQVNNQPVKCTLISAKPSLIVHFDTNDAHLQQHLRLGQSVIEQTLRIAGWRLEKWSVSTYDDGAEMD